MDKLRQIDPTNYKPDLILELDDENLIVEFQSTKINNDFSRRGHSYVAIVDQLKENNILLDEKPEDISKKTDVPLEKVLEIKEKNL